MTTTTITTTTSELEIKPESSDDLLAILLGIFIPLTVIVLIVAIVILYRLKKKPGKQGKYIDDNFDNNSIGIAMEAKSSSMDDEYTNIMSKNYGSTAQLKQRTDSEEDLGILKL